MKNKLYILIGSIIIVLAIVAASIFLISTKDVEPAATDFELDGTWKLFNYGVPMTDEQYLVFNDGTVNGYKNGNDTPSITSKFEYSTGSLKLTDLGIEYKADQITDNYLALYDSNLTEYALVRSTGDGINYQNFDWNLLVGTWDVILHGKDFAGSEQMIFDGTTVKDFRDGNTTPYLDSSYTIEDNGMLVINGIGLELNLCYLDSDLAILVETHTGYAYELVKHK